MRILLDAVPYIEQENSGFGEHTPGLFERRLSIRHEHHAEPADDRTKLAVFERQFQRIGFAPFDVPASFELRASVVEHCFA